MSFVIQSHVFSSGDPIPEKYTGEGADVSPPMEWEKAPKETKEFALICDDPDAPTPEPWVHWLIYKIPGTVSKLPEGIATTETVKLPPGALQGKNSWNKIGYGGPMPPPGHGTHRYFFKLYALDAPLTVGAGTSKADLLNAMQGHILEQVELMGKYERQ